MSDAGGTSEPKANKLPPRPNERPKIPRPKKSRDALRCEGKEQFDKLLSKRSADRRNQHDEAEANNPDMTAMGSFIEGAKVYMLLAVCVICRAFAVVLLKNAMDHLETPVFLVFSHQIALIALLLFLKSQNWASLPRLSMAQLQSIVPLAIMESLEMIFFSSSLNNGSVLFVVALTSAISTALIPWASRAVLAGLTGAVQLSMDSKQLTAAIVAIAGTVVQLTTHPRPHFTTVVSLGLWAAVRAAHCLWIALKEGPHLQHSPALLRLLPAETVQKLLEAAQTPLPTPMATSLHQHALACLPVLTLGLLLQEGTELMEHEATVPSMTTVLLSAVCFAVAEATRLTARCSETIAACMDGVYMVVLAAVITPTQPLSGTVALQAVGMVLAALGLFVLRRTAEPPLPKSTAASGLPLIKPSDCLSPEASLEVV